MYLVNSITVKKQDQVVLKDISLTIPKQKFTTVVGISGSGKTTLLHTLAGLNELSAGNIEPKIETFQVAIVMQDHGLFPWKTVAQNIEMGRLNVPKDQEYLNQIMKDLALESLTNRYPHQLSGGQSQRVAIARALYQRPSMILMDEPTASLDEMTSLKFLQLLKTIQGNYSMTIVYVTHQLQQAIEISDQLVVLDHGRVNRIVTKQELQQTTIYNELRQQMLANMKKDSQGD